MNTSTVSTTVNPKEFSELHVLAEKRLLCEQSLLEAECSSTDAVDASCQQVGAVTIVGDWSE